MKRTIIILIALVLFISLPVFASAPTQENTPPPTSEDEMFYDFTNLSTEELSSIIGNLHPDMDGQYPGYEDILACGIPTWSEGYIIVYDGVEIEIQIGNSIPTPIGTITFSINSSGEIVATLNLFNCGIYIHNIFKFKPKN